MCTPEKIESLIINRKCRDWACCTGGMATPGCVLGRNTKVWSFLSRPRRYLSPSRPTSRARPSTHVPGPHTTITLNVKVSEGLFHAPEPLPGAVVTPPPSPPPPPATDREIRLFLGPVIAMQPGQPGIRRTYDTFLIVDLHGIMQAGFSISLSTVPSTWLSLLVRGSVHSSNAFGFIPIQYIVAVYCLGGGLWTPLIGYVSIT